jgi:hypothetical protein
VSASVYQEWSPEGYVSCDGGNWGDTVNLNFLKSLLDEPLFYFRILQLVTRIFRKKLTKVTGLFQKNSARFPDFLKIVHQGSRTFRKKRAVKSPLSTSDRIRDFTGHSGKKPARLPDFFEIVRQSHQTF